MENTFNLAIWDQMVLFMDSRIFFFMMEILALVFRIFVGSLNHVILYLTAI